MLQILVQGLIFFIFLMAFWSIIKIKNIWNLGAEVSSNKEAVIHSILPTATATVIFIILLYIFESGVLRYS